MNDFDWKAVIKTVAPVLGTVLGGPLVGTGVKILGEVLLGDSNAAAEQIQEVIGKGLSPEQVVLLKRADQDFQLKMKEAGIRLEELDQRDRQDARGREIKTGDTKGVHALAFLILATFAVSAWWVLAGYQDIKVDPQQAMLIGAMIGYISSKADVVVSYFFGSSRGSKEKTAQLSEALARAAVDRGRA